MSDEKFELSRRNALVGLGTVGVASAGAGLGTSAFFSDREEFPDNRIQAGEFGMTVKQYIKKVNQDGIGPDEKKFEYRSSEKGVWKTDRIKIKDAKPGDEYKFCWKIKVHDNPGYVAAAGSYEDLTGYEASNVQADDLWDIEDNEDLATLGESATATLKTKYPVEEGTETAVVEYGDGEAGGLLSLLESLASGIPVSDKNEDPIRFEPSEWIIVCVKITIPEDIGNELQGAELSLDLLFYAEQARHNDPDSVVENAVDELDND